MDYIKLWVKIGLIFFSLLILAIGIILHHSPTIGVGIGLFILFNYFCWGLEKGLPYWVKWKT